VGAPNPVVQPQNQILTTHIDPQEEIIKFSDKHTMEEYTVGKQIG